jgi:hypothetical protein
VILTLMVTPRHLKGLDARRFQQDICESLDQTFGIGAQCVLGSPTTQIQTQLHRLAMLAFSPHVHYPDSSKDGSCARRLIRAEKLQNKGEVVEPINTDLGWF